MNRDDARQAPEVDATFRAIFEANFAYVWNALRRFGIADADREDLANEVFFRVFKALDKYDPARPARPWLLAFAARVASEHRRLARSKHEVLDEAPDRPAPTSAPENALERSAQRAVLNEGLATLDDDRRTVFVLYELEEMTTSEIARTLEIPEGTVSSRLRTARADLAAAVRRIMAQKGKP